MNSFDESAHALEAAQTLTANPTEILGTTPLEALCQGIERLGWTIGKRDNVGERYRVAFEVGKLKYSLYWCRASGERFILSSDYVVPENRDELSLRRRAGYVNRRVWFAKALISIEDKPSVSFAYEGAMPTHNVDTALTAAKNAVDAAASMFFEREHADD